MKKIAFGIACGLAALFVLILMLTLYGRSIRQEETDSMLSQAIDSTLAGVMSENNYTINENSAFVADFLKALLIQKNSDSDITISVLDADYTLGILSVEVTEKYKHPNGKEGSVSEVRTVIFDKAKEVLPEYKTVRFYVEDALYKEYCIQKDSVCTMPVSPKLEGKEFRCWRFVTGGIGEAEGFNQTDSNGGRTVLGADGMVHIVSEDTELIAVFQ